MSELADLRSKIDALDGEILRLLNERATLALGVGEIKNREGLPIYAPDREEAVLRGLVERSKGPLPAKAVRAIYREIMSATLALETDVVIACFGSHGGPCHLAARQKFGSSVSYSYFPDIEGALGCVARCEADCAVVPIEDAEHGAVVQTLDKLSVTELKICAEITQGSEGNNEDEQTSRFLVLGRHPTPATGHDRTVLLIRVQDRPGALVDALEPFKQGGLNLSHFATRPAAKGSNDVLVFVEVDRHTRDEHFSELLRDLSRRCRAVKVLGTYPKTCG